MLPSRQGEMKLLPKIYQLIKNTLRQLNILNCCVFKRINLRILKRLSSPLISKRHLYEGQSNFKGRGKDRDFGSCVNASGVNRPHSGTRAEEKQHKRGTVGEVCPSWLPITERFVSLKTPKTRPFVLKNKPHIEAEETAKVGGAVLVDLWSQNQRGDKVYPRLSCWGFRLLVEDAACMNTTGVCWQQVLNRWPWGGFKGFPAVYTPQVQLQ